MDLGFLLVRTHQQGVRKILREPLLLDIGHYSMIHRYKYASHLGGQSTSDSSFEKHKIQF
ncbi:unnamed protein product [Schistosoma mansoni]|uniref:Smp_205180 n=1 Tax=Schistosoma mansoni TaxID=6183 RepID=UPI00022C8715|nr:unnamed protein product [Schistosoma mansoni]|eukprot:XP_018644681.1 unnamed protein product [Schistosoma mansoni]